MFLLNDLYFNNFSTVYKPNVTTVVTTPHLLSGHISDGLK